MISRLECVLEPKKLTRLLNAKKQNSKRSALLQNPKFNADERNNLIFSLASTTINLEVILHTYEVQTSGKNQRD